MSVTLEPLMCQEAGEIINQNVPCLLQTITAAKNDFHDTELFEII